MEAQENNNNNHHLAISFRYLASFALLERRELTIKK
jgi:hypothetical protein